MRKCDSIIELSDSYNFYTNFLVNEWKSNQTQFGYVAMVNSPITHPGERIIKLETDTGRVCGFFHVNDGKMVPIQRSYTTKDVEIGERLLRQLGRYATDEFDLGETLSVTIEATENFLNKQELIHDIRYFSRHPKNLDNFTIRQLINGMNMCYGYDRLAGGLKVYNTKDDLIQYDTFNTYAVKKTVTGNQLIVVPVDEHFKVVNTGDLLSKILDSDGVENFPAVLELYVNDAEGTRCIKRYKLWDKLRT